MSSATAITRLQVPRDFAKPSGTYRLRVWLAMAGLIAFVLVYFGLAGWFTWIAYRMLVGAFNGGSGAVAAFFSALPAAFLAVLTEVPLEWRRAVLEWSALAARHRSEDGELSAPSRRDEYLYWQALVGAWPFGWDGESNVAPFTERLKLFMQKATREAKELSSWLTPEPAYEESVARFVEGTLSDGELRAKIAAF